MRQAGGRGVDDVGRTPGQHLVGPFGQHAAVALVDVDEFRQPVAVDQLGVAEDDRLLAEQLVDQLGSDDRPGERNSSGL